MLESKGSLVGGFLFELFPTTSTLRNKLCVPFPMERVCVSTPDSRSRTRALTRPRKALRTIPLPRAAADPRVSPIFPSPAPVQSKESKIALQDRPLPPGAGRRPLAAPGRERSRVAPGAPRSRARRAQSPKTGTAYLLTSARGSHRPRRHRHRAPALRGRAASGRPFSPADAAAQPARQPQVASPRESRPRSQAPRLPSPAPRPRPWR